jgi:dipeptidyl aminopeptidase/acylaminoacyl peptidase
MIRNFVRLLAAMAAFLPFAAGAQESAKLPVEAFGTIPIFRSPHLSPDGGHLAAIQSYKGRPVVVIYDLHAAKGATPAIVESEDWTVNGLRWVKNDALMLVIKSSQKVGDDRLRTWVRSLLVDAQGKNARMLMENEQTLSNNTNSADVTDNLPDDPGHFLTTLYRHHMSVGATVYGVDPFYDDLLQVDVKTGTSHVVQEGVADTIEWLTDGHGNVTGRLDHNDVTRMDRLMLMTKGEMHEAGRFDASGDKGAGVEGLSEDGKALVSVVRDDKGFRILVRRDIATGAETALFAAPGYDVDNALTDEWTGRVIGASYISDKPQYVYFDPVRQALQLGLEKAFPGQSVGIVSEDSTRNTLIIALQGAAMAPVYFVLDRTTHEMHPVARPYPALADVALPEVKSYDYKARDGLKIPAYLTLPLDKPAKNLPLVVMPHGGPAPMGPEDAGRHFRRREEDNRRRHRRSQARLHRGRQLWRLCGAGGRDPDAGALCLRRRFCRGFRSAPDAANRASRLWRKFQGLRLLGHPHRLIGRELGSAGRHFPGAQCRQGA